MVQFSALNICRLLGLGASTHLHFTHSSLYLLSIDYFPSHTHDLLLSSWGVYYLSLLLVFLFNHSQSVKVACVFVAFHSVSLWEPYML